MSKKLKFLAIGFLALALVVGVGANYANATLTLEALTVTSSGALTLEGAAASVITVGALNTGGIAIGNGDTVKTISLGAGNAVNTIKIGDHATPINVITLGGAASTLSIGATLLGASPLVFEGLTANAFELTFAIPDVSADATITFPSVTGTLATLAGTETFTNKTLTSPILTTPALGTPSALVLTNATGLPAAAVLAGSFGTGAYVMDSSLQVVTIELGHATDTTLARSGAGAITVEGTAVLLSGGALGTPASGTLTNATGLPISGLTASTSTALGVGSVELGHATDTTLARSGAGAITVEGVQVLLSGAALGTPASGVLTNATGLPTAGLVDSAVTSTKMSAGAKTHTIVIPVPDPGAANADITAGYVLWTPSVAVTITKVYTIAETAWVAAAAANDASVVVTNAAVGTVSTLAVVTALAAGSSTDTGAITNGAVVAGTNVTIAVTTNGTADAPRQNIQIEYTTTN